MKKYLLILILLFFTYSCADKHIYTTIVNKNTPYISNYNLSKEEILKSYDNGNTQVYKKEEIKNIIGEIENNNKDIYTLQKADVLNIIGSPYLIKNEVVIELWQYRSPFCILNIIWDNSKHGIKEIVSYNNDLNKINNKKCILDIIKLNPDNKK